MKDNGHFNGSPKRAHLVPRRKGERYFLTFYITRLTARSSRAIAGLRAVCDKYLTDRYELEIVDLYEQPELAREAQLIAAPTLVKELPLPVRRLIGDLSNEQRVLAGLDLRPGS